MFGKVIAVSCDVICLTLKWDNSCHLGSTVLMFYLGKNKIEKKYFWKDAAIINNYNSI